MYDDSHVVQYGKAVCACIVLLDSLVCYDKEAVRNASEKVFKMVDKDDLNGLQSHIRHAIDVIEQGLEQYE